VHNQAQHHRQEISKNVWVTFCALARSSPRRRASSLARCSSASLPFRSPGFADARADASSFSSCTAVPHHPRDDTRVSDDKHTLAHCSQAEQICYLITLHISTHPSNTSHTTLCNQIYAAPPVK